MLLPKLTPTAIPEPWFAKRRTMVEELEELQYEEDRYARERSLAVVTRFDAIPPTTTTAPAEAASHPDPLHDPDDLNNPFTAGGSSNNLQIPTHLGTNFGDYNQDYSTVSASPGVSDEEL